MTIPPTHLIITQLTTCGSEHTRVITQYRLASECMFMYSYQMIHAQVLVATPPYQQGVRGLGEGPGNTMATDTAALAPGNQTTLACPAGGIQFIEALKVEHPVCLTIYYVQSGWDLASHYMILAVQRCSI